MDVDEGKSVAEEETRSEKVEKEQLIKGFKYGSTYVPCPDGQFERLNTKKGIEICGFFLKKNVRLLHSRLPLQPMHCFGFLVEPFVSHGRAFVCLRFPNLYPGSARVLVRCSSHVRKRCLSNCENGNP